MSIHPLEHVRIQEYAVACEALESRDLAHRIRNHHVLTLVRLEPPSTLLEALATYAFDCETVAESRLDLLRHGLDENRRLHRENTALRLRLTDYRRQTKRVPA